MNESRIVQLRQDLGWTQDRLATESGVGIRTVQRLEAGNDASLETLSLVADALQVDVRELFVRIDNDELSDRVESMESRAAEQQLARQRVANAWLWLFIGIGIAVSMVSFGSGGQVGGVLFLAYWGGGIPIFIALRRLLLDPRLDARYPLSRSRHQVREQKRRGATVPESALPVE
ncbi:MAG TPA: helix-turn-helix transcriptional regulator [Plantibacter sp.]|uniref:helix-turn-helix domain-containing protein n=1 Tax=unclassified Plantibacter TaxID=2624265 RepID=UPI002C797534|nr:helix-turn-helix transcriptional regulator [Plantibacter sp.]